MLRSLGHGWRDFKEAPDTLCVRYNWIILCAFEGLLHPRFDPPLPHAKPEVAGANFWVIPPQTRYVIVADSRRCDRAVFHFSHVPPLLADATRAQGYISRRLTARELSEVRSIVSGIDADYRHPTPLSEVRYEIVLLRLTLLALQALDSKPLHPLHTLARDRVDRAVTWYTEHMADAPSLQQVAAAVHLSPTHLRRHFYERLGRSPKAIFNRARMQRATGLLIGSSATLNEIAERCGFTSASDFCRAFKGEFHVTPSAWRRNVNSAGAPARPFKA